MRVRRPLPVHASPPPRWWFYNRPLSTHGMNAILLLLPRGERFILDAVRPYMATVTDPTLRAQLRTFCAQEAMHEKEHAKAEPLLEQQGFDLTPSRRLMSRSFGALTRLLPARAALAVAVGLEHYGAVLGAEVLRSEHCEHAHPVLAELVRWHAAEEVEHKAVVFDLWRSVGGGYALRLPALLFASALVLVLRSWVAADLLRQDDLATPAAIAENRAFRRTVQTASDMCRSALLSALRPGFHPNDLDDRDVLEAWLLSRGEPVEPLAC